MHVADLFVLIVNAVLNGCLCDEHPNIQKWWLGINLVFPTFHSWLYCENSIAKWFSFLFFGLHRQHQGKIFLESYFLPQKISCIENFLILRNIVTDDRSEFEFCAANLFGSLPSKPAVD